jgi:4'-phosphopantetheinyl transferase
VLHPAEIAWLTGLGPGDRAQEFARLWTVKEAYLKALGTGLARDTRAFAVALDQPSSARITDPDATHPVEHASTVWVQAGHVLAAAAVVVLAALP